MPLATAVYAAPQHSVHGPGPCTLLRVERVDMHAAHAACSQSCAEIGLALWGMSCNAPRGIRGSTNMPGLGTMPSRGSSNCGSGGGQKSARSAAGSSSARGAGPSARGSTGSGSPPTGPAFRGSSSDSNTMRDSMRRTPGQVRAMMAASIAGPGGSRWKFELQNILAPELRRCEVENDELQRKLAAAQAKAARYAKELAEIKLRIGDVLAGAGMTVIERHCESSQTSSGSAAVTHSRSERRETAPFEPPSSPASLHLPSAARGSNSPLGGLSPRPPSQRLDWLEHPVEVVGPALGTALCPTSPVHTPSHTPRYVSVSPIASPGRASSRSPRPSSEMAAASCSGACSGVGQAAPSSCASPPSQHPVTNHPAAQSTSSAEQMLPVILTPAAAAVGSWTPSPLPDDDERRIEALSNEGIGALPPPGHITASVPLRATVRPGGSHGCGGNFRCGLHNAGQLAPGAANPAGVSISPELMANMMAQLSAASAASNSLLSSTSVGLPTASNDGANRQQQMLSVSSAGGSSSLSAGAGTRSQSRSGAAQASARTQARTL